MKLLPFLALLFCSCTIIPGPHGKAIFGGDYMNVDYTDGPVHYHADVMQHSPIYTAAGASAGNVIGSAGAAATGFQLAKNGATTATRVAGAFVPATAVIPNRHAQRTTPKPK